MVTGSLYLGSGMHVGLYWITCWWHNHVLNTLPVWKIHEQMPHNTVTYLLAFVAVMLTHDDRVLEVCRNYRSHICICFQSFLGLWWCLSIFNASSQCMWWAVSGTTSQLWKDCESTDASSMTYGSTIRPTKVNCYFSSTWKSKVGMRRWI